LCTWTGKTLRGDFDVDHIIPFSLTRCNDLWNLVPAAKEVNRQKSQRLVSCHTLESSRKRIYECWQLLRESFPTRFESEATRALIRSSSFSPDWKERAFYGLVERVETLAIMRGVPRWDPA